MESGQEAERRIGRYVVQEYTALRLVAEAQRNPLVSLAVLWGCILPVVALTMPWRGDTRLFISLTVAAIGVVVSLLVLRFVPRRERLAVDVEMGVCQVTRFYLFPPVTRVVVQAALEQVAAVRWSRQVWRDGRDLEAVRWVVELVGEDGQTWRLSKEAEEEPTRELARLVAEVIARPLAEG